MGIRTGKIAYIDPYSGISGDMLMGAFLDLGFPLENLNAVITGMAISGCSLKMTKTRKGGLAAIKFDCLVEPMKRVGVHLHDVRQMLDSCKASPRAKEMAKQIFQRIAEAEARVHGITPEAIHFHEVGAVDSMIDILGAAMALDFFNFDRILSSPVNTGSGTVQCEHGLLPVPVPAVAELLKGVPSYSSGAPRELTTPTGAAISATAVSAFGPMPLMKIQATGYGAGTADLDGASNTLRIITGEAMAHFSTEELVVMETNIDDMSPESYEYVMEEVFRAGALDVFLTPVIMKKGRPAVKITALCEEERAGEINRILFRETSTFGVRQWKVARNKIDREIRRVDTEYGPVKVKIGFLEGGEARIAPEYDSCVKAARAKGVAFQDVYNAARRAAEGAEKE